MKVVNIYIKYCAQMDIEEHIMLYKKDNPIRFKFFFQYIKDIKMCTQLKIESASGKVVSSPGNIKLKQRSIQRWLD